MTALVVADSASEWRRLKALAVARGLRYSGMMSNTIPEKDAVFCPAQHEVSPAPSAWAR
jgi:hypothetical protein